MQNDLEQEIDKLLEEGTQHLLRGELWEVYVILYKLKKVISVLRLFLF